MQLPPWEMVREALMQTVLPPFGAAIAVMVVAAAALRRRYVPYASILAVAAAIAVGNWTANINPDWWPSDRRLHLLPWLAIAAATAIAVCQLRRLRRGVGWSLFATVLAVAVVRVLPGEFLRTPWWAVPAFILMNCLYGPAAISLSRRIHPASVALLFAIALFAAGGVGIHAHSKSVLDVATITSMAFLAFAALALFRFADTSPALPAGGLLLTGLAFTGSYETFSQIPWYAFALAAGCPLPMFTAVRLPGRYRLLPFLLSLLLAGLAVYLAQAAEPLDFDNL